MDAADVAVVALAVVLIAGLVWFFFGPRRARSARLEGGVQRVEVTVRGGYSPDVIRVRQGIPLELVFDRQESGECTSRVVFPDLRVSAGLPAYARTAVRVDPSEAGSFGFACGMNMIHGTLVVEPDEESANVPSAPGGHGGASGPPAPAVGAPRAGEERGRPRRRPRKPLSGRRRSRT